MQVRPSRYWIETVWNGFGLLQYLVSSMKRFETISDYIVIIITIINIYIYIHTLGGSSHFSTKYIIYPYGSKHILRKCFGYDLGGCLVPF